MDAEQIRKALFPHEEIIKRLQAENEELKAKVETLTQELINATTQQPLHKEDTRAKRTGKAKAESRQGDELGEARGDSEVSPD